MYRSLLNMAAIAGAVVVMSGSALAADSKAAKADVVPTPPPAPAPKTVEVQNGDSLSTIAATQQMETWVPLWNANPDLSDPDMIHPGQKLVVPTGPTTDRPLPAGVVAEPVAVARPAAPVAVRKAPANYAAGAGGLLQRIRMRESGGNYAINTGNGYYGAYQFNLGTWQGVGGTGLPSQASPAEQDMRAQMLYDRRGCSPWPNTCY